MPSFEGEPTPEQRQQNAAELFKSLIAVASDHDQKIQKLFELLPEIRDAMLARAEEAVDAAFGATREDVASDAEKRIGEASARISVALNQRIDEQVKAMRGLKKQGDTELAAMRATVEQARPLLAQLADKLAAEAVALSDTQRAEVERIVSSERVKFAESVSGIQLQLRGAYGYGVVYRVGDIVSWRGSSYVASVNGELGEPKFDSKEWQILAMRGVAGADGPRGGDATAAIAAHNTDPDAHAALFNARLKTRTVSGSTTAEVREILTVLTTATITDPANPVNGDFYFVRVGGFLTVTVGGVGYTSGLLLRSYTSSLGGQWTTSPFAFGSPLYEVSTIGPHVPSATPYLLQTTEGRILFSASPGITAAQVGAETTAQLDARDTANRARANHTGTQAVSTISPVSSSSLIGRHAGGSGAAQEVSVGNGLEFSGSGIRRQALTGDVTASAGSNATAIALDVVTNAKLANVATATVKGRLSAGTGDPEDVTLDALKTAVGADAATATTAGTVPGIGGTAAGNAATVGQLLGAETFQLLPGSTFGQVAVSGTGATTRTALQSSPRTGATVPSYAECQSFQTSWSRGVGGNAVNWANFSYSVRINFAALTGDGSSHRVVFSSGTPLSATGFSGTFRGAGFSVVVVSGTPTLHTVIGDGSGATETATSTTIATGRVYDVRVLVQAGTYQLFLDDALISTITSEGVPTGSTNNSELRHASSNPTEGEIQGAITALKINGP